MTFYKTLSALIIALSVAACSDTNNNTPQVDETLNNQILTDFSNNVAQASYNDLKAKASVLNDNIVAFADDKTEDKLTACRDSWKAARQAWEQTESFLFGPVSTEDIDPSIDTWPVNFEDLNAQIASKNEFTQTYVNALDNSLKGFHPIEYLLFGENGNKKASDFTNAHEVEYLKALGSNVKQLTSKVADEWNPNAGNYAAQFTTAGKGSSDYQTQTVAFEQLVKAMSDICGEVANGKMDEVYVQKDPSLEESPYAKNSITDFTNNIKGIENVYLAKYTTDGKGLEDLVRLHSLSLDGEIKTNLANALNALNKITDPFGEAISSQPVQVQNAIDAINTLNTTLEDKLLPFVSQHTR